MKKLSIIMALVLIIALLTACGSQTVAPAATTQTAAPQAEAQTPSVEQEESAEESIKLPDGYTLRDMQVFIKASSGSSGDRVTRAWASALERYLGITITPITESVPQPITYSYLVAEPAGTAFCNYIVPNSMNYYQETTDKGWDVMNEYQIVCGIRNDPVMIAVRPDDARFADCNNIDDVFQYIIAHPEESFLMGVNAVGGDGEIAFYRIQNFYKQQGLSLDNCVLVNAQGQNPANTSFLGGATDVLFSAAGSIITLANEGEVRVLGVLDDEPYVFLPDVQLASDCGLMVESSISTALVMAPDTDPAVAQFFSDCFAAIAGDPDFKASLEAEGLNLFFIPKAECEAYMAEQQVEIKGIYDSLK